MVAIDPPYRLDPLQNIVDIKWPEDKKKACSAGGAIVGGAELHASTVLWDRFGKVGYCFQVFPQLAGSVETYIGALTLSMDSSVFNTPAWQAANLYPGDPGAPAAITVWNRFAAEAISFFIPYLGHPSTDVVPGFGPYAEAAGSTSISCSHTDPLTGVTTGPIGASPPNINGGKGFKNKNFCKGDSFEDGESST